jgi:hypothetical protein
MGARKRPGERHWLMRQLAKLYLHLLPKPLALMLKTPRQAQEGSDPIRKCIGNLAEHVISEKENLCLKACSRAERSGRAGVAPFVGQEDLLVSRTAIPFHSGIAGQVAVGIGMAPSAHSGKGMR